MNKPSTRVLVRFAQHKRDVGTNIGHFWYNDGYFEVKDPDIEGAQGFYPKHGTIDWSAEQYASGLTYPDCDPSVPLLVYHNGEMVFGRHASSSGKSYQIGWCVANCIRFDGKFIGVLSEKFTEAGEWNDGPDDEYAYSLTNGIELACTELRSRIDREIDLLIHFTPLRPQRRGFEAQTAQLARLTLVWNERYHAYQQDGNTHPWSAMTSDEFAAQSGLRETQLPLGMQWSLSRAAREDR